MAHAHDEKLERLAATELARDLSDAQVTRLGRLIEWLEVPAGATVETAASGSPWSYHVVVGSLLVDAEDVSFAVPAGGWLVTSPETPAHTVVAATDVVAVAVGRRELATLRGWTEVPDGSAPWAVPAPAVAARAPRREFDRGHDSEAGDRVGVGGGSGRHRSSVRREDGVAARVVGRESLGVRFV